MGGVMAKDADPDKNEEEQLSKYKDMVKKLTLKLA